MAVFLRKLECFDGILFLTTNLLCQFDAAILNRIHLVMKYEELDRDARRTIMIHFLEMASTDFGDEDLDRLAEVKLNGQQSTWPSGRIRNKGTSTRLKRASSSSSSQYSSCSAD